MLVLWYVAGALSYRDIEELASEGLLGQSLSGELIKIQSDQEL